MIHKNSGSMVVGRITFIVATMLLSESGALAIDGAGTAEQPYLVATLAEFDELANDPEYWDDYIRLECDPNLAGRTYTTAVIAPVIEGADNVVFTGTFDGNGHKIIGLTIDASDVGGDYLALFGQTGSGAVIKNLGIENCTVTSKSDVNYMAGLVGRNEGGTISECYAAATLTSPNSGGSYGSMWFVGILIGYNMEGAIVDCHASGSILGGATMGVGGLVGRNYLGTVTNCYATSSIQGGEPASSTGGLVGDNKGTLSNCYANGDVTAGRSVSPGLGGLSGNNAGSISDCYATGSIRGGRYSNTIGGLVGENTGSIKDSFSTGTVVGEEDTQYIGGLVARNMGSILRCRATGELITMQHSENVGGLTGLNTADINCCYAEQAIRIGENSRFGGLVGHNFEGNVSNCYVRGSVEATASSSWRGGLIGWDDRGVISDCYAAISMEGLEIAGLVGLANDTSVNNCFWDAELCPSAGSGRYAGIGKTTADLMQLYTFIGWGCAGAWVLDEKNDYPRLAWENTPGTPIPCVTLDGAGTEQDPWLISSQLDFDAFTQDTDYWNGYVRLECDIDLTGRTYTDAVIGERLRSGFAGTFDGNAHRITNLVIDGRLNTFDYLGLFGELGSEAVVTRLGVVNCTIYGEALYTYAHYAGPLAGRNHGVISQCYTTGQLRIGERYRTAGGLVGINSGTISLCYSNCTVTADSDTRYIGGLAGQNEGLINGCYSTGLVSAGEDVVDVGGLTGREYSPGTVEDSFWDKDSSGQPTSAGGTGKSVYEMIHADTYRNAGWDFVEESDNGDEDIWTICEGTNYPRFTWQIPEGDILCPYGVGFEDFALLASAWLSGPSDQRWNTECDLFVSDPNTIDLHDLFVLSGQWLEGIGPRPSLIAIGHWEFNEVGGDIAADGSPFGRDGTLVNMDDNDWVEGKVGNALVFDGIDDFVEITGFAGLLGGQSRTVCAWVRTNTPGRVIIAWGPAAAGSRWTTVVDSDGHLRLEVGGGAIVGSTVVGDGAWHHVAVVAEDDGSPNINEVRLYVDGLPDEPGLNTSNRTINTLAGPDVTIGQYLGAGFFEGAIDEVRIYDRPLSPEEIAALAL